MPEGKTAIRPKTGNAPTLQANKSTVNFHRIFPESLGMLEVARQSAHRDSEEIVEEH
jgi:hypothetical protein